MKNKYKYLILILITVIALVFIYKYIEASKPVKTFDDVLNVQNARENEILSNTNYSIDNPNVILDPYGVSPLTALVVFQTSDLSTATVTVKGKDGDDDIVNTFLPSKLHILPIYGLYPNYENTVTISSSDEENTFTIKTAELPKDIKNATDVNKDNNGSEFYFTTSLKGNPIGYDKKGNVRWYLTKKYKWEFNRLSNGHILLGNDNLISTPYYSMGLVEMDMLGKIYFEYNLPGGYHHDVYELSNGNLLVASNNFEGGTVEDYIVELDRNTGKIVKTIDLYKLLPVSDDNDWFKLNSLVYDAKTNSITVSGDAKNMLVNVDYASGEINWIIANDINKKYKKYLLNSDNDIMYPTNPSSLVLTDEGNIAFVNTSDNNNYISVYSVDNTKKRVNNINNISLGSKTKNTNLDYSNGVYVVNMNKEIKRVSDNNVSSVFSTNYDIYSTKYMNIYAGDVYITGKGQKLGNIGVTKTINNPGILIWKIDDSVFKKYHLNIYKDANRLVLSGKFNKNDDVQLILDNVLDKKTYDVNISESPYIDETCEGKKVDVTTYVNEEGLSGKYYIYLRINGTTYKLNKSVTFY